MPTVWYDIVRSSDVDPTAIWADTWEAEWGGHYGSEAAVLSAERRLRSHPLYKIFCDSFSEGSKVLEGGCGLAFWVKLLREENRDVIGVDFDFRTVERLNSSLPMLPVAQGDVTKLAFDDESFDGYISLGVVEHFTEGPQEALREAWRILKPGGKLVIAVPYLNPVRQCLRPFTAPSRLWKKISSNYKFYQFLYSRLEMTSYLQEVGFTVLGCYPFAPHVFLVRFPLFRAIFNFFFNKLRGKKLKVGNLNINNRAEEINAKVVSPNEHRTEQILRKIDELSWLRQLFGHEIVYICQKNAKN